MTPANQTDQAWRIQPVAKVVVQKLNEVPGKTIAVDQLNLDRQDGEFFVMLGPSGAGKTTTLHLIAGLLEPTGGKIFHRRP